MCCFSRPIDLVADTRIFARSEIGRQFLVYGLRYAWPSELAMVLPLPVPPDPSEDALSSMGGLLKSKYRSPITLLEKFEACCESDKRALGHANLRTPALLLLAWLLEPWKDCAAAVGRGAR